MEVDPRCGGNAFAEAAHPLPQRDASVAPPGLESDHLGRAGIAVCTFTTGAPVGNLDSPDSRSRRRLAKFGTGLCLALGTLGTVQYEKRACSHPAVFRQWRRGGATRSAGVRLHIRSRPPSFLRRVVRSANQPEPDLNLDHGRSRPFSSLWKIGRRTLFRAGRSSLDKHKQDLNDVITRFQLTA